MTREWIKCSDELPPKGELVETKIDDHQGCRNEGCKLVRDGRNGRLWFVDKKLSMYVYYEPTHWRPL